MGLSAVRSNILSRFSLLLCNQPLSVLSRLKHQIKPVCASCSQKQVPHQSYALVQQRYQHTTSSSCLDSLSPWQRMKWNMGLYGKLQVSNIKLVVAGNNLYICCTDLIDVAEFIKVLNLPDTFNSWFLILQLHLWMVNVKVSQMGKEGVLLKKYMYSHMWRNVEERLKTFKDLQSRERRDTLQNYYSTMIMSTLYYDEGLMGSDKLMANSLWVQLFAMDPAVEADKLELMVKYVRKQVYHHDHLDHYLIMNPGYISFLPLHDDKYDQNKALQHLQYLRSDK